MQHVKIIRESNVRDGKLIHAGTAMLISSQPVTVRKPK